MANMAYCRFQNTLMDLQDCYEEMNEMSDTDSLEDLSTEEKRAMEKMIKLCADIALDYGSLVGVHVEEVD